MHNAKADTPIIRDAGPDDLDIIAEFNARLASETEDVTLDRERLRRGVESLLADPGKGRYFMAVSEGRIVGQAMITTEWSDWRNGMWWWFQSVYVHTDWRRKGVFRALYDHIVERARQMDGVVGLRLYVDDENGSAQQTYIRLGMEASNYQMFELPFSNGDTDSPSQG